MTQCSEIKQLLSKNYAISTKYKHSSFLEEKLRNSILLKNLKNKKGRLHPDNSLKYINTDLKKLNNNSFLEVYKNDQEIPEDIRDSVQ